MKTIISLAFLSMAICCTSVAFAVTFDWAVVGNPGNSVDTEVMRTDGTTGYGSVDYIFRISKHEVTNTQYAEFLNAVAATDAKGLYNIFMSSRTSGGINRSGSSGSYIYSVKADAVGQGLSGDDYNYGNKPVAWVSFFDAMRFVNWLENGQPSGVQDAGTTEDGVYMISDGLSEIRAINAKYFIPSEDEWYKAAYHKNDGVTGNYWVYPTSTDLVPNNNPPADDNGNSVNFRDRDGNLATGNFSYTLTDVGAYKLSDSPYGTFDQGGNVWEWNESIDRSLSAHGERGGTWYAPSISSHASTRGIGGFPTVEDSGFGFRVASRIPEPSTLLLICVGCCGAVDAE